MPWGRIDDAHWRHRKVAALDDALRKPCLALFWLAVSWANDNRTDGAVSATGIRQLDGTKEEAEELVRVGLWERDGRGYRIHDFLDFNKSQAQLAHEKAQRTMAGHAGAAARWSSDGETHGKSPHDMHGGVHGETDGGGDAPYPVSRTPVLPAPAPLSRDGLPHLDDDARTFLEGVTGKPILTVGQKQLAEYDRQIEQHGLPAVIAAYQKVAKTMRNPTARQLVWSALRVLEPFATPQDLRRIEIQERESEEQRAHRQRLEATQRRISELRGTA
jgi:hypothetical protein